MSQHTNPTSELVAYLQKHANRCRVAGWLGSLFHVQVTADIAGEVVENEKAVVALEHKAECEDNEAIRCLEEALVDGLDSSDIPKVREAIRHLRVSVQTEQKIAEALA